MTKKKVLPVKKYEPASFQVQDTLLKTPASCMPTNLAEEKEKFLKNGKTPKFHLKDRSKVEELALKTKNNIRFDLLGEAQYILEKVREDYGNGEYYLEHAFGPRITKEEATPILLKYISENNIPESVKIHWCDNLTCSAKMVWTGPNVNQNRPELRKYSLWLNGSDENPYMRESGIRCLMDHEIGTHFYRSFNDGLQPWYADRARFGLRKLGTFEGQCSEEGFAAIHTVLRGRVRYLWGAAMGYYIACKSAEMTFKELFDHLGRYTSNPDYRWKQAMRVKRGLSNPNDLGGFGNDQCYFEGAVNILRRMEDLDFQLLMMGKVCYDELDRIKRVVRKDVVQYPNFMKNINAYKKTLRKIFTLNSLGGMHPQRGPPTAYLKHLEEKKKGKTTHKGKKVRYKPSSVLKNLNSIKGKNKNSSKRHVSEDKEEEIKSFSCSNPFINMHLRKKPTTEIEKILKDEPKALKDIKELTETIVVKDKTLDEQLGKLQDIVKNHEWVKGDDCYKNNLKEEALNGKKSIEQQRDISEEYTTLSLDHKDFESSSNQYDNSTERNLFSAPPQACNLHSAHSTSDVNTNNMLCATRQTSTGTNSYIDIIDCKHDTVMYTLCPSDSCLSTLTGESVEDIPVEPICLDGSQEVDMNDKSHKTWIKKSSVSEPKQLLNQRSKQPTNQILYRNRRQILRTPVANLSSFDSIVEQMNSTSDMDNSNPMPFINKRISLKTSETEINYSTEQSDKESRPPSPGACLPTPVNSVYNLHREKRVPVGCQHFDTRQIDNYSNDQKLFYQLLHTDDIISQSMSKNGFNNVSLWKSSNYRPLSAGTDRLVKMHLMKLSASSKIAKPKPNPLKPNLTSLLNVNSKNNTFTAFNHIAGPTNSFYVNPFE